MIILPDRFMTAQAQAVADGIDVLNAHFEPSLSAESRYSFI